MRIRLSRKTAIILEFITTVVAYAMFVWIDWRLAIAMALFEISNVLSEKLFADKGCQGEDR